VLILLIVVLGVVVATAFAADNMGHVQLGLIIGKPVHVRLFFLLLSSFLAGCFSTVLLNLYLRTRLKKKEAASKVEDDQFFSE